MTPPSTAAPCPHEDPGLQPERTALAWGRTLMTLCTAAALYLRWLPTHGTFVLTLFAVALCVAAGIYGTQRRRYRRAATGIAGEWLTPDAVAVGLTAGACLVLGVLGLVTILVF
ncbi:hypothetical protein KVA01_04150 [Kocuria varians]|uniref:DUF202 domain-containing protein n=1 Tax=Kocuria varians TaxID=1272 RepID=A0A4Y4D657_KOCVA|nr:DUF202 domain-containing protein [Kocuria varians]GEC98260.1 hypothetical protein KVA01_04150 [Kocuria varians]